MEISIPTWPYNFFTAILLPFLAVVILHCPRSSRASFSVLCVFFIVIVGVQLLVSLVVLSLARGVQDWLSAAIVTFSRSRTSRHHRGVPAAATSERNISFTRCCAASPPVPHLPRLLLVWPFHCLSKSSLTIRTAVALRCRSGRRCRCPCRRYPSPFAVVRCLHGHAPRGRLGTQTETTPFKYITNLNASSRTPGTPVRERKSPNPNPSGPEASAPDAHVRNTE